MTAIFDAQYGVRRRSGRLPDTEAMLTTSPAPRPVMAGRKARHIRNTPRTLMSKTSSQSRGVISVSGATGFGDPGVVDQDRYLLTGQAPGELLDVVGAGDVADPVRDVRTEPGRGLLERGRVAARDHHPGPVGEQGPGDGPAEAAASPVTSAVR